MKEKQTDWPGFVTEAAIEAVKTAANEYEGAIVNGRIAKPVEYQDARGFIWQADRMIESVAADLQKKDADALKQVRAGLAELKKVSRRPCRRERRSRIMRPCSRSWRASNLPPAS